MILADAAYFLTKKDESRSMKVAVMPIEFQKYFTWELILEESENE